MAEHRIQTPVSDEVIAGRPGHLQDHDALGARIGALLTFRFTDEWSLAGIIFGVIMGTSVGLASAFALFQKFTPGHFFIWLGTSILAWIAGESIAFAANFSLITVPLVALAVAGITGLGLIHLQPRLQAE